MFRSAPSRIKIASWEIDRVLNDGLNVGIVLADAGYGKSADFRRFLSARGLRWVVGVPANQMIYRTTASAALMPATGTGRPLKRLVATEKRHAVAAYIEVLPKKSWRNLVWRKGTKGPLQGRFIAIRVRVGDGAADSRGRHLLGDEAWLVVERRSSGETKYYLSNLPAKTSLLKLVRVTKRRWVCEQAHWEAKDDLGLDHFEGRSWNGLHHHERRVMMALLFV